MEKYIQELIILKEIQEIKIKDLELKEMKNQKLDKLFLDTHYQEKDVFFVDNLVYIYIR